MAESKAVRVEIYSDVICPWCYVGKARLDKALAMIDPALAPEVIWRAFELNPKMPAGGMGRKDYLTAKFGSSDISVMEQRLNAAGNPDGLQFNFGAMKVVPNTFKAHRLLWFAHKKGKQHQLAEVLFRNYFTDGLDPGSDDVLVKAALEAGLAAGDVETFLSGNEGTSEVKAELENAASLNIHSVPTFVVNGEVVASGAIASTELKRLIEQAANLNMVST
ncbi:MAG: DsbA family oxidoreductase [Cyanobacteria bacterium SZAS LIN-3]|nr:DsbA family oxidoreductase [Cyanobacteria bacterium SZAS LIN-3]